MKKAGEEGAMGGHTVIGVIQEALKEEKAREEESETEILRRRETRKSLNRRVSFASHATIRYSPSFRVDVHIVDYFLKREHQHRHLVLKRVLDSHLTIDHPVQTTIPQPNTLLNP